MYLPPHRNMPPYDERKYSGIFTGHDPTRGPSQEVSKTLAGRVGSGQEVSRVGSGQEVLRIGSGQEAFKYHGSGQVMSGRDALARPDPRQAT